MKLKPREPDQLDVMWSLMHADLNVFAEWGFGVLAGQDTPYLPNWHIEAMNHHLTLCEQGQITRLLITVPPRYLKSHCASICFPAWILGRKPAAKLMCVSYGDKPTLEFAANTRSLMRTEDYLQSGKIMFPQKAPWLAAWENEILSFPSSMYDDQVDTLVYFADQAKRGFDNKAEIEWFKRPPPGRLFSYS